MHPTTLPRLPMLEESRLVHRAGQLRRRVMESVTLPSG